MTFTTDSFFEMETLARKAGWERLCPFLWKKPILFCETKPHALQANRNSNDEYGV